MKDDKYIGDKKNIPQYKKDMQREERDSKKVGKKFSDSVEFPSICKKTLS